MDRKQRQMRCTMSEFKTRDDEGKLWIEGYFAVFDKIYELWPGVTESVAPGAFAKTLSGDIRALIDHESRLVLGRCKAGTLTLTEDALGLWGRIEINQNDADAMNLYSRVKRGDVDQCSFGFAIMNEEPVYGNDNAVHWTIKEVELFEVSVVTFPAYEDTSVSARKKDYETICKRKADTWRLRTLQKMKGEHKNGIKSTDAAKES